MSINHEDMSNEVLFNLVKALAIEVTNHGADESELVITGNLSDEDADVIMKANTFLSAFAAVLIQIVDKQNPGFARMVLDVWSSEPIQKLVQLAFMDEINEAVERLQQGIADLENFANNEEN